MDTPDEREQRAEQLVSYAVHTLMHASKVLARVGILLPPAHDLDDPDVLMRAIELALRRFMETTKMFDGDSFVASGHQAALES